MLTHEINKTVIHIPSALKLVGIIAGIWAILVVLIATLAYLPGHPGFSIFTTYLSDIGATAGWPQIIFNSGTLIAAPIRYLVLVLLIFRLAQLGAGRAFIVSTLTIGLISTTGTVVMTAVPFNVSLSIHKLGIPLYFLGVVVLQTLIGIREWSLRDIPKILPWLSFLLVVVYFVFATLVIFHEQGIVSRNTPVIWEWLAFFSSVVWVFAQSILLGKMENAH
jgi:flagellar biosynthesis protein FliQ